MKYFSIIACIFGLYLFACADTTENNCTDDGCPEFVSMIQELDAEFASYEVIPTITTESKDDFVYSLNNCITHLYKDVPLNQQIPMKVIICLVLEHGIKMITGYYLYLGQNGQVGV